MNKVMERFAGHRADLKSGDESKPAFHFRREGHEVSDMEVVVLEEVGGKDNVYRVARERLWMNRMRVFGEENKRR